MLMTTMLEIVLARERGRQKFGRIEDNLLHGNAEDCGWQGEIGGVFPAGVLKFTAAVWCPRDHKGGTPRGCRVPHPYACAGRGQRKGVSYREGCGVHGGD